MLIDRGNTQQSRTEDMINKAAQLKASGHIHLIKCISHTLHTSVRNANADSLVASRFTRHLQLVDRSAITICDVIAAQYSVLTPHRVILIDQQNT